MNDPVPIDPTLHATALAAARQATTCGCDPSYEVQVHTGTGEVRVRIDHGEGCDA